MTNTPKEGRYQIWLGRFLLIVGIIILMVLQLIPNNDLANELGSAYWIIVPLPTLMIVAGCMLYWRGRQHRAKARAVTVLSDSVPDVLYLRAFGTDPSTVRHVLSSLFMPNIYSGFATVEEQLGDVLQPFGDLVAIGKPGESLPLPGAARMYASDVEWKDVITAQMKAARLVIIRAGSTEGLLWELQQSVRLLNPRKLLLLVLSMKPKAFESFKTQADRVLPVPLPVADKIKSFGRKSAFIWFSPDWTPILLPLRAPWFRRSCFKPLRRLFKFALKPLFEEFGLEWKAPRVSAATVAAMSVLAIFPLLVLVLIGAFVADRIGGKSKPPLPITPPPPVASVPAWKTVTIKDVSFDAPAGFQLRSVEMAPSENPDLLEYFEAYDTGVIGGRYLILSRVGYKPGVQLSLDGAINNALTEVAAKLDDPDPHVGSPTALTVDGLEGRRASLKGRIGAAPVWIEMLALQGAQKRWFIQDTRTSESAAQDTKRILDSVHITPAASPSPSPVSAPADWKTLTVKELSLEAPADLTLRPTSSPELSPEVANNVQSSETFTSGIVTRRLLNVSRLEYKPGFQLSLDGAMNAGMVQAVKLIDDPNPKLTSKDTAIDGLPARLASCQGLRRGIPTWIEVLWVQDAQTIWVVIGANGTESGPSELPRILNSVHIKHDP